MFQYENNIYWLGLGNIPSRTYVYLFIPQVVIKRRKYQLMDVVRIRQDQSKRV